MRDPRDSPIIFKAKALGIKFHGLQNVKRMVKRFGADAVLQGLNQISNECRRAIENPRVKLDSICPEMRMGVARSSSVVQRARDRVRQVGKVRGEIAKQDIKKKAEKERTQQEQITDLLKSLVTGSPGSSTGSDAKSLVQAIMVGVGANLISGSIKDPVKAAKLTAAALAKAGISMKMLVATGGVIVAYEALAQYGGIGLPSMTEFGTMLSDAYENLGKAEPKPTETKQDTEQPGWFGGKADNTTTMRTDENYNKTAGFDANNPLGLDERLNPYRKIEPPLTLPFAEPRVVKVPLPANEIPVPGLNDDWSTPKMTKNITVYDNQLLKYNPGVALGNTSNVTFIKEGDGWRVRFIDKHKKLNEYNALDTMQFVPP